jgi:hypothetical protein
MQSMWTRYDLGDWDAVLETGDAILGRADEPTTQLAVLADLYRRDVLLHRGVGDPEGDVEAMLLPRAREIGDSQVLVPGFRVAALARLGRGDLAGALALVEEADDRLRDFIGVRSWFLDWAAPVCRRGSAADLLRSLVERGIEHLARDAGSLASARGALAELDGDPPTALERYEDAAARWSAFPSVLEHAHALAGAGRSLLALGRPADAAARLREARERYASLRATPLVGEADALLERASSEASEAAG